MAGTREYNNRYLRYIAVACLVVFLLSGSLLLISLWENRQGVFPEDTAIGLESSIEYNGKKYVLKKDVQTFLVLGLDKFEEAAGSDSYNNDKQSDFVMLFVIDNANKTCGAIHINRDTMVDMNVLGVAGQKIGTVNKQLALAHTYGTGKEVSCGNVADAVSGLLYNVKIDHYMSVTMDAVPVYNDLVGGVEVTILDDFAGIDDTLIEGEIVTLLGDHALNYIRSRKGLDDSTNSNRMIRQRQYLEALYQKSFDLVQRDASFIAEAGIQMADYLVSDRDIDQLQTLFEKISGYDFTGIRSLEGDTVLGEKHIEFYPDVDSLKKVVVDLFYRAQD